MTTKLRHEQDWPLVLRCSPEDARRIAEAAPFRYEYAHGVLRAMAGGTLAHSRVIIMEYVLLDTTRQRADLYRKVGDLWPQTAILSDGEVHLESIGLRTPLARFYAGTGIRKEEEVP